MLSHLLLSDRSCVLLQTAGLTDSDPGDSNPQHCHQLSLIIPLSCCWQHGGSLSMPNSRALLIDPPLILLQTAALTDSDSGEEGAIPSKPYKVQKGPSGNCYPTQNGYHPSTTAAAPAPQLNGFSGHHQDQQWQDGRNGYEASDVAVVSRSIMPYAQY